MIGEIIKTWRNAKQIPQKDLAEKIGISADTLCRIEKNQQSLSGETFVKILAWLISK